MSPFGRMQGLFDDEYGDSRVTDATTLLLADLLNSGKPSDVRKVIARYNKAAGESAAGAVYIFSESGQPNTKEEILTRVTNYSIMEQQERNRSLSTPPSPTENKGLQPNSRSVEEARQLMKLRMLADAVKAARNEPEDTEESWLTIEAGKSVMHA